MEEALQWIGMAAGILGAIVVSLNMGPKITGAGFVVFLVSSTSWVVVGLLQGEPPLTIQNVFLTFVNLFGIYRWLIRAPKDG